MLPVLTLLAPAAVAVFGRREVRMAHRAARRQRHCALLAIVEELPWVVLALPRLRSQPRQRKSGHTRCGGKQDQL